MERRVDLFGRHHRGAGQANRRQHANQQDERTVRRARPLGRHRRLEDAETLALAIRFHAFHQLRLFVALQQRIIEIFRRLPVARHHLEFLLALGLALDGHPGIYALAGDTDGRDGTEPIAGALLYPDSLARAKALGLQARASLHDNDAHGFFSTLGDSVVTGPTLTNVNDFRAILVTPEAAG